MIKPENKDEIIEFLKSRIAELRGRLDEAIIELEVDGDDDGFVLDAPSTNFDQIEELKDFCDKTLIEVAF